MPPCLWHRLRFAMLGSAHTFHSELELAFQPLLELGMLALPLSHQLQLDHTYLALINS